MLHSKIMPAPEFPAREGHPNITPVLLPGDARRNLRIPILLLWLLLLTTVAITGLTWYALRGQRAVLEEAQRRSQQQALLLLATRVGHALTLALHEPFQLLKNVSHLEMTDARLGELGKRFPYVEEVLILDRHMEPLYSYPPLVDEYRKRLVEWISQKLRAEAATHDGSRSSLRSFMETVDGQPALFAFQPISDAVPTAGEGSLHVEGWALIRCNLDRLRSDVIAPPLAAFDGEHAGTVRLQDPDATQLPSDLDTALAPLLPGWRLALSPSVHSAPAHAGQWAIIAASAGAVLAVMLICVIIAWEIRREYALVELRDRFVANVSHELKTPLSLIRMYAETLYLHRLADPDRQHEYHSMILRESEHLSRMIGDVLDFARLRQGLSLYRLNATDMTATVAAVVQQYRPEWEARGARVEADLVTQLSPVAHDPQGIAQILLNLLDNAIKYGGGGQPVRIRLQGDHDWVELQIIDAGPGLDSSARKQLRNSMRRGRMAESAQGSGLGLALVERIAVAHHAHFILDAPEGGTGVKAVVSFPVYKGSA